MNVRIQKMTIQNFKGIKSLEIQFNGHDAIVYGDNATGKTSLFDAFLWLLFGKDSSDRSDFGVKPYDANGQEIHNLETVVEAAIEIDGVKVATLKHMLKENWVKKNGQSEQVFSGNQHKYWVNGISHSAGEYEKFVADIAPKKIFPLITNPMAFNALKWQERRDVLLKLCPVDIDTLLMAKPEYKKISEEIAMRGTDIYGLKKLKKEQKSRDDKEMEQIPVRIAELQLLIAPGLEEKYREALEKQAILRQMRDHLASEAQDHTAEIAMVKSLSSEVMELENQIKRETSKLTNERLNTAMRIRSDLFSFRSKVKLAQEYKTAEESKMADASKAAEELEATVEFLRRKWYTVAEEPFKEPEIKESCPYCGQSLPESVKEETISKAQKAFEEKKEVGLAELSKDGKKTKEILSRMQSEIQKCQSNIEKLNADIESLNKKIEAAEVELRIYEEEPDFSKNPVIAMLTEELEAKKAALAEAKELIAPSVDSNADQKKQLDQQLEAVNAIISLKQQQDSVEHRIGELEFRQRELGLQIATTEQDLIKIDSFVTERCKALEESINALFPTVQWKLFDVQINAGIKDTCVCMIGGVPFTDANNAAKINAGMEIIDVLSRFYGASVPVFVDNAESVNDLRMIEGQRIALTVSHDPALKIEIQNERKIV